MSFTWDQRKALANVTKHGVSFEEAVTVFGDPFARVHADTLDPERALLFGQSEKHRLLVVVFVDVNEDVTRIISARPTTSHERKHYEDDT